MADAENPAWCASASQTVEVASQVGTSLDGSLRHHEVLDPVDVENSLTIERPILSQLRNGTFDNLRAHHGLPDLHNANPAPTDLQINVSIFVGVSIIGAHMFVMKNLIMCFSPLATRAHETYIPDVIESRQLQINYSSRLFRLVITFD